MKSKINFFLLLFFAVIMANAQSVTMSYSFSEETGTFNSIASTGTLLSVNSYDDGHGEIDLSGDGFSFSYCGQDYSTMSVNTNGAVRLGATNFSSLSNNLSSSSYYPVIAPLWDDMKFEDYGNSQGIYYQLDGSGNQQILTIEWNNVIRYGNAGQTVSYQIKLYEETGDIELIYGDMSNAANWTSATVSIGINNRENDVTAFQSVTPGNPATVSTTDDNNTISKDEIAGIAEGTIYRFTFIPPALYTVTFNVTDDNSIPVENANIIINDTTITTDASGVATIDLYSGSTYNYTVYKEGYNSVDSSVTVVDSDIDIDITLTEAVTYTVTFLIKNEYDEVLPNANIEISYYNLTTDNNGIATINLANGDYPFTVSLVGYQDSTSTVTVNDADVNDTIALKEQTTNCISFSVLQNDIGIASETFGIAVADFNGDGWNDAVIVDAYDDIELYFWDTTANKMDTTKHTLGEDRWRYDVEAIDIDNDGDMDFITSPFDSNGDYGIEVWENNGSGSFTLKTDQIAKWTSGHMLAVGDLNGDGYDDIVFPNDDDLTILLNDGNGNFVPNGQSGFSVNSAEDVDLADFDADGDLDIVVVRSGSEGFVGKVFVNDGTGQVTYTGQELSKGNANGVATGDIDGDGDIDIAIAPFNGSISFWINDGLGGFMEGDTLFDVSWLYEKISLKDLNFDGYLDIITDNDIWFNDKHNPGHFILQTQFSVNSDEFAVVDMNQDGFDDLYMGNFSSSTGDYIFLQNPPEIYDIADTICYGDSLLIGNTWQTESGVYYDNDLCGVIQRISLVVRDEINTTITENNGTLTVAQDSATYQWIDCDNNNEPIDGETSQSFTPSATGHYAVVVTVETCSDTSDCYEFTLPTGLEKINSDITIYPNPTNGVINIETSASLSSVLNLQITDVTGKVIKQLSIDNHHYSIDLSNQPNGIYFIKIQTDSNIFTEKVIKK